MPHYAPAMHLAASVLETLTLKGGVETLVVLAPDHEARGGGVVIAKNGWDTPFGRLEPDTSAVEEILSDAAIGATVNDELTADHSASVLMPYIKYYQPEVKIVTLLIKKGTSATKLDTLAEVIVGMDGAFTLASIDYSHDQSPEDCANFDKETIRAVGEDDRAALLRMNGASLDSPESLCILMQMGTLKGATPSLYAHETQNFSTDGEPLAASYLVYTLADNTDALQP